MSIPERLKMWGIVDSQHIGDGAYVGQTPDGIATFTSDGIEITRPVFIEYHAWEELKRYGERVFGGDDG